MVYQKLVAGRVRLQFLRWGVDLKFEGEIVDQLVYRWVASMANFVFQESCVPASTSKYCGRLIHQRS